VQDEAPQDGMDGRLAALEEAVQARTADLTAALDQRTQLLHELDHRVKNNLQLISSLMLMQSRRAADRAVREALAAMHARVNAIGVVHRRLFQTDDVGRFDLSEFVRDMVAELSGPSGRRDITIHCDLQPAPVPAAQAAPLALLINELLTNAFRHAFPPGRPGRLSITTVNISNNLRIEIEDDGVGSTPGEPTGDPGFGLTMVELLGRQLQARIERETAATGTRTTVTLPKRTSEEQ
jgi:two-component sensor histidine kinase